MNNGCFFPADILLPRGNFEKWSVIACDQYTADTSYWVRVKETVGDEPSALDLILPEAFLGGNDAERIADINGTMRRYLAEGLFNEYKNAVIYTERLQTDGCIRRGLIGMIDLRLYDFRPGSNAAIRATEETVLERIPPRVKIRENAPLELPHIMLLADDPDNSVIGAVADRRDSFQKLYDFELMMRGGHISGWLLDDNAVSAADGALTALKEKNNGFLFCVGDGNHSLASAKKAYESHPNDISPYALV